MKLWFMAIAVSVAMGSAALVKAGGDACCQAGQCPAGAGDKLLASGQPATQPAPVNKVCPIENGPVNPAVTTVYEGKVIGFCCKDCIEAFKKDPAKYMAQIDKEKDK
jgi:YHS domain-containing protein